MYCTDFDCDLSPKSEEDPEQETDGWVQTSKLWMTPNKIINVYFINPKVLEGWKVGDTNNRMTVDDILTWAAEWSSGLVLCTGIPTFVKTDLVEESNVRVSFKGESVVQAVCFN